MRDNYVCLSTSRRRFRPRPVLNIQSNIQRNAFIYVNIVHMEVDDAAVSRKYHFFYTFLIQADLKIFFRPDLNYPT